MKAFSTLLLLSLIGCTLTQPRPRWRPQVGEMVRTHYHTGYWPDKEPVTNRVVRVDWIEYCPGETYSWWRVYADGLPGVDVGWVMPNY